MEIVAVMQSRTLNNSTVPEFKSRKSFFYKKKYENVLWPIMTPIDHSPIDRWSLQTPWGLCLPTRFVNNGAVYDSQLHLMGLKFESEFEWEAWHFVFD